MCFNYCITNITNINIIIYKYIISDEKQCNKFKYFQNEKMRILSLNKIIKKLKLLIMKKLYYIVVLKIKSKD